MFCDHNWPDLHRPIIADEVISAVWTTPTPYNHYYALTDQARRDCEWETAWYWSNTTLELCRNGASTSQYYGGLAIIYRGALFQTMGNLLQAADSYKTAYNALSLNAEPQWKWNQAVAQFGLGLVLFSQNQDEAIRLLSASSQAMDELRQLDAGSHQTACLAKARMEHCIEAFHPSHSAPSLNLGTPPVIGTTDAGENISAIPVPSSDILVGQVRLLGRMYNNVALDSAALQRHTSATEQYAFCMRDSCQQGIGLDRGDYVLFTPDNANSTTNLKVVRVDLPTGSYTTVAQVENGKDITSLRSHNVLCKRPVITIAASDPTLRILGSVLAGLKAP